MQYIDENEIIDSNMDLLTNFFWEIFSLLYNFLFNNKKTILKTYPPKFMILNVNFALKLINPRQCKRFICLKWVLNKMSTILHTQFNHHTLPVTPFKPVPIFRLLLQEPND